MRTPTFKSQKKKHDSVSSENPDISAGNKHRGPRLDAPDRFWNRPVVRWAMLVAALGMVLATYWPALSAGALYMDDKFYLGAPEIRNPGLASVNKIFGEVLAPTIVKGYYQPLALISTMLDFLDPAAANNLRPFHRTSLFLHIINVALVILLLNLLFRNWPIACLLGLLYGLHPLNVDVVLWVAERKAVLSMCFALCSIVLYLLYTRRERLTNRRDRRLLAASLFMYLCAVLAKPTAVPLVALLLVLDYWPLMRLTWRAVIEKTPFFLVCGLFAIITIISQTQTLDEGKVEMMHGVFLPFVIVYSIGFYLFKTVWPTHLVYDYPFPQFFSLTNPGVLLLLLATAALLVALVFSARRTRAWIAGGLFFCIALSPTLGVVSFTSSVVSNRFIYLPMVGLLLPLAWIGNSLWNAAEKKMKASRKRILIVILGMVLAIGSAGLTRNYESKWHDTLKLLHYYEALSPNDWKLHTRLGNEWIEREKFDLAVDEFKKAAILNPGWAENHLNLGRALFTLGRFPEAQQAFAAGLHLTPKDWRAHMLMGFTFSQQNMPDSGLKEMYAAAQLAPQQAEIHFGIAGILAQQGKRDEATKEYRKTLELNPRFTDAQNALDSLAPAKQ